MATSGVQSSLCLPVHQAALRSPRVTLPPRSAAHASTSSFLRLASSCRVGRGRRVSTKLTRMRSDMRPPRICCLAVSDDNTGNMGKLLVLGGTGFVGSAVCQLAAEAGYQVVAVSRRGSPAESVAFDADWRAGDIIADPSLVSCILEEGGFVGVVHAVGMLLANDLNRLASGSGSTPSPGTTYDQVTRETALAAAAALAAAPTATPVPPLVFISAAEAGWDPDPPLTPPFLREYLAAKRAVERKLAEYAAEGKLRPTVLRPSLVWTPERLPSIPPVAAFYLGNLLGIPGIDRPVQVGVVARAAMVAVRDSEISGVQNFTAMEDLAVKWNASSIAK